MLTAYSTCCGSQTGRTVGWLSVVCVQHVLYINGMAKFEINEKITNKRGAWVRLRVYPHTSNLYPVYGFDNWSPTYDPEITMDESVTSKSRNFIERQMTSFLRNR